MDRGTSNSEPPIHPGFSVIHSNHLEDLREIAVQWIKSHPLNPLENEQFLVQSNGMGQWLKMALAADDGCGICAALTVQLPGHFLWRAYRAVLGDGQIPMNSPYDKDRLVWRLLKLLPRVISPSDGSMSEDVEMVRESASTFLPLKQFLEGGDPRKYYQLACQLASLFDQYQVYRADWLQAWSSEQDLLINGRGERSPLPQEQRWQAELWRRIRSDIGVDLRETSRADLHKRFLNRAEHLLERPLTLPRRVVVFGISSLPGAVVEALHVISDHCQVLLFVQNPCRQYWADIVEKRNSDLSGGLDIISFSDDNEGLTSHENQLQDGSSLFSNDVNPLLAAWGKQGRDYIGMLCNFEQTLDEFQQTELFRDVVPQEEAGTLLQQVQQAILDLKAVPDIPTISSDDDSITFQLCHSPQREIEILHDQLLSFFDSTPELAPRDIIVMAPDIKGYAPHIAAVFGNLSPRDSRYIPFTIADRPEQESMPMLLGLEKLLSMPDSRMSVADVMELLQIPAFCNKFGLAESDIPKLNLWIQGSGIRWGLNPEHRRALDLSMNHREERDKHNGLLSLNVGDVPGGSCHIWEQNSWRFGLRRMMLGYAVGTGAPWKGIEPYDEVGGLDSSLAGILFSILELLEKQMIALTSEAVPELWCTRIRTLLKDFFLATRSSDRLWISHMEELLDQWLQSCNEADLKDDLTLPVVRDYLLKSMTESSISPRFLAGMVNFCTLMPMRAIPFKVVCLLGMNDGAYPRSKPPLDFDLMSMQGFYRPGDRSRREDDRYLFLEALISAREKLYISYTGRSVRDNSERVPSVLVGQLRDYISSGWQVEDMEHSHIKDANPYDIADTRRSELKDGVAVAFGEKRASILDRLTTQHPLQPFSRSYFKQDSETRLFTYAGEWRDILDTQIQGVEPYGKTADDLPLETDGEYVDTQIGQSARKTLFSMLKPPQFEGALTLQSLIRFMKNPVKSFFNQRLKVYFDDIDVTAEEVEPFDLERWTPFKAALQLFDAAVSARSEQRNEAVNNIEQQLLRTGQMPVNAFGEIAVETISDSVYKMVEFYDQLILEWPIKADALEVSLPLSIEGCGVTVVEDLIDNVRKKGPLIERDSIDGDHLLHSQEELFARWECYPGKINDEQGRLSRPDALVSLWIKHLAGAARCFTLTSYLIATDGVVIFSPLESSSARAFMGDIVEHWWEAMRSPLPVTAKTAMAYLKDQDLVNADGVNSENDEVNRQKGEKSARKAYEGDGFISDGEVGYCRYLKRIFPDFDSLWQAEENRFVELSLTLYAPILQQIAS